MDFEKFKLKLNQNYDYLIYVMYYRKWKGDRASFDAKRAMISGHLESIYDLCVDNWNLVLELSREDLAMVLNLL